MTKQDTLDGVDLDRLRQWMDERSLGSGDLEDVAQLTDPKEGVASFLEKRPPNFTGQ